MITIDTIKKIGKGIYKLYSGIGIFAMGLLAFCVIFAVVARYFFSYSWKQLEEFMTTLFAFTTFWGMGICVLEDEHVIIDVLYDQIKPSIKRWVTVFNYVIVLVINSIFFYYSLNYVKQAGNQISMGMEIPMTYMYGIMPVCTALCAVCILFKIIEFITVPLSKFESKNIELTH